VNYFQLSRSARYSILFAVPLLLAYEALAFALGGSATAGVRNGADVLLKSLFLTLGGQRGLLVFDIVLLAVGRTLVWRDRHTGVPLRPWIFATMLGEALGLAILVGTVVGILTALILQGPAALAGGGVPFFGHGVGLRTKRRNYAASAAASPAISAARRRPLSIM
jgi:hypothetical protein